MPDLRPRDHQLYVDLERAFAGKSFLLGKDKWVDFESKSSLAMVSGDAESIDRLVASKKVTSLGSINEKRHFVIPAKCADVPKN